MTIEKLTEHERAWLRGNKDTKPEGHKALRIIDALTSEAAIANAALDACYEWVSGPMMGDPPQELADWHTNRYVWDAINLTWRPRGR